MFLVQMNLSVQSNMLFLHISYILITILGVEAIIIYLCLSRKRDKYLAMRHRELSIKNRNMFRMKIQPN